MNKAAPLVVLLVLTLVIGACGGGGPSETAGTQLDVAGPDAGPDAGSTITSAGPPTTEVPTPTTAETPASTGATPGTEGNPLPLGATAQVGDFTVTVTRFVADADELMAAADPYNEPPADGNLFALVYLEATYEGPGQASVYEDLSVGYLGSDNRVYTDASCAVIGPDDMVFEPELVAGGTAAGSFCLEVPISTMGSGDVFVESLLSFDGDRTWWVAG
jgi:hypothetical protein